MIEIAPRKFEVHTTHTDALMHVMFCKIDDKVGWRLPTVEECNWIASNMPAERMFRSAYWTSETVDSDTAIVYNYFYNKSERENKVYHNFVRPVRTITEEVTNGN